MDGPHDRTAPAAEVPHPETEAAHRWADSFRRRREALRRELGEGSRSLDDVLAAADDTDDGAITLLFVLESLPGAGKVATRRRLAQLDLPEVVPVRTLTPEQRRLVLDSFPMATDGAARAERAS
ncbi:hypothetical protein [Dermatobacter hominis]|uniref:hypothetical protein n=1 Tax=Dermatobacter hominis TaxID=2884263 RepID=UPI001D123B53|nr:hypothetical protein [Dermatobacter hominis]UDY36198.1 hypothetical protein LH044_01360 [Dermatobacter hominis]